MSTSKLDKAARKDNAAKKVGNVFKNMIQSLTTTLDLVADGKPVNLRDLGNGLNDEMEKLTRVKIIKDESQISEADEKGLKKKSLYGKYTTEKLGPLAKAFEKKEKTWIKKVKGTEMQAALERIVSEVQTWLGKKTYESAEVLDFIRYVVNKIHEEKDEEKYTRWILVLIKALQAIADTTNRLIKRKGDDNYHQALLAKPDVKKGLAGLTGLDEEKLKKYILTAGHSETIATLFDVNADAKVKEEPKEQKSGNATVEEKMETIIENTEALLKATDMKLDAKDDTGKKLLEKVRKLPPAKHEEKYDMELGELEEALQDSDLGGALDALDQALDEYAGEKTAGNLAKVRQAASAEVSGYTLKKIMRSYHQKSRQVSMGAHVRLKMITVSEKVKANKLVDVLEKYVNNKEDMKGTKAAARLDAVAKLINLQIARGWANDGRIDVTYEAGKTYEQARKEGVKAKRTPLVKVEGEQLQLANLSLDTVTTEGIDRAEREQTTYKKKLKEVADGATGSDRRLMKSAAGIASDSIATLLELDLKTLFKTKVAGKEITEKDWKYSQKIDTDDGTKDYKVTATHEGEITLNDVPEGSELHKIVHAAGAKLTHKEIGDLVTKSKNETKQYLGTSTLPAHAKEEHVAQSAETAEKIILKELEGLTSDHIQQKNGEQVYVEDDSGVEAKLAKKVLDYLSVIKQLVNGHAIKDNVLKLVAKLETGEGKHKLLVKKEEIAALQTPEPAAAATAEQPKPEEKKEEQKDEKKQELPPDQNENDEEQPIITNQNEEQEKKKEENEVQKDENASGRKPKEEPKKSDEDDKPKKQK